jgi:hypothetical protein
MAKKKRKEEQEEEKYEWTPPDFDEKGFLQKDMRGTKALFISTLLGLALGIIAYLTTGVSAYIGIVVIFGGALLLRFVYPFFKIEFKSLEKKTLAGNYILLIFLALGVWIILLNPPFSDQIPPQIMDQNTFFVQDGTVEKYLGSSTPITADQDLTNITVDVRDNGRIASVQIEIHASTAAAGTFTDMQSTDTYGRYEFKDTYPMVGDGSSTQYVFTIKVTDGVGFTATQTGSFVVVPA